MEKRESQFEQEKNVFDIEAAQIPLADTVRKLYVDFVFVMDVTGSMQPCIDMTKKMVFRLYDRFASEMANEYQREIEQVRAKVIAFRDYYCDGRYAIEKSDFFYLPKETDKLKEFVDGLEAKGGGDVPETSLEALALAMNSEWVQVERENSKRHIIVLFTDAPAHPLEKNAGSKPIGYPEDMFKNFGELVDAWNGVANQGAYSEEAKGIRGIQMDQDAKRLILVAPIEKTAEEYKDKDVISWKDIQNSAMSRVVAKNIEAAKGAEEITDDVIIKLLCRSAAQ